MEAVVQAPLLFLRNYFSYDLELLPAPEAHLPLGGSPRAPAPSLLL